MLLASSSSLFPCAYERQFLSASQQGSFEHQNDQDQVFQKGLMALKENRLEDALEALTKAEHRNPGDGHVRNFRGIVLARLGQTAEARAEYQEAIRCDPGMEDAYRNLGFLEWAEHRPSEAREALQHALKLSPTDSFARHYLGRVQLDAQLYDEALRELEQSDVPWTADPSFLIQVTTGYLALGKQEEARKTLLRLDICSLGDFQSAQAASLFLAAHESDLAIELLRRWSDRTSVGWAEFDLALAYLVSGSYEKAIERARYYAGLLQTKGAKADELAPVWSMIGIAHARLGHGDQAVDALRLAARADPNSEEGWLNLTRELMEIGRFSDAISAVQEGIVSLPKSYALLLRLGAANLAAGRYAVAENVFRSLAAAGDPLPTSYVGLAQALLRQGRADEAASALVAVQKNIGPHFLLSYFLGLSLDRAGKPSEALTAFQEAVRLNPNSAEAHFGVGKTELALGRSNDALVELQETLRLSPGNVQAQRLLPQAYHRATGAGGEPGLAPAPSEAPPQDEDNLIGDFSLPTWKMPSQEKNGFYFSKPAARS